MPKVETCPVASSWPWSRRSPWSSCAAATAVGLSRGDDPRRSSIDRDALAAGGSAEAPPQVLVVRRRGGVPPSWAGRLGSTPGVTAIARTARTQATLRRSRRAGGATIDAVPQGYAIPLDVLVVQPRAYADDPPPGGARGSAACRRDTALLSRTSARLRGLGVGDRLTLAGGRELRVAGIVDDEVVGFAEVVLTGRDAGVATTRRGSCSSQPPGRNGSSAGWRGTTRCDPHPVADIANLAPAGRAAARNQGTVRRVRGGPAVRLRLDPHRAALVRPQHRDPISADPRRRHLQPAAVRAAAPRAAHARAPRAFERRGPSDYAGCFAPRRIPGSGSLSLHAWGLAIDINAAANPRLGDSRQDRRLVRAMEDAGFTWGGRWPTVPDPMHFELHP